MFKFLKDKLKSVVTNFSKKVEEEAKDIEEDIPPEKPTPPPKPTPKKEPEPEKKPTKEPPKEKPDPTPQKELPTVEEKKTEQPPVEEKKPEPAPVQEPKKQELHVEEKKSEPKEEPVEEKKPEPTAEKPVEKSPVKKETPEHHIALPKKEEPKKLEAPHPVTPSPQEKSETNPAKKEEKKRQGFFGRIFGKKEEKPVEPKKQEPEIPEKKPETERKPEILPETIPEKVPEQPAEPPKKKSLFETIKQKITHKELSEQKFEELFWDFEVALLENNVAVEVIEKIKRDMHNSLVGIPIPRAEVEPRIAHTLKKSITELFDVPPVKLMERISAKKPYVILFLGINGAGKTTSIAKLAHMLQKQNKTVVMAAGDTFRAAAIQQLETHAQRLGIRLIKHDYGSDAAAVAFDAVAYAKAKGIDVVLIDTAGRLHSNTNLMDELKKIIRVAQPDLKVFIGESITGNDCVEQATQFNEAVGIDGIILSKADVDEKGGAAISVSYVTKRPIMFLGMGQEYGDLKEFSSEVVLEGLGF